MEKNKKDLLETRASHLEWAKQRAIEYAKKGDTSQALASMVSDLRKHELLEDHPAIMMQGMLMLSGNLSTAEQVEKFITDIQ